MISQRKKKKREKRKEKKKKVKGTKKQGNGKDGEKPLALRFVVINDRRLDNRLEIGNNLGSNSTATSKSRSKAGALEIPEHLSGITPPSEPVSALNQVNDSHKG